MKKMPLVSVVVSCYNHEKYVQDCIQSIIDQTYENIELIIIDDGSKDTSVQKIEEMTEICTQRFVRFEFRHRENRGLCATLNEALDWCRGKYYSPFASDDLMLPNKTECQANFLEKNSNSIGAFGGVILLWENHQKNRVLKRKDFSFKDIILHNHELPAPTAMVRTRNIKETGGYQADLAIEDWYMWLKLTESGKVMSYLNIPLAYYRRHSSNTSNNLLLMNDERKKVLNKFSNVDGSIMEKAEAYCYLCLANELIPHDKISSLKAYMKYLKLNGYFTFFNKKSIKYILRFIVNYKAM